MVAERARNWKLDQEDTLPEENTGVEDMCLVHMTVVAEGGKKGEEHSGNNLELEGPVEAVAAGIAGGIDAAAVHRQREVNRRRVAGAGQETVLRVPGPKHTGCTETPAPTRRSSACSPLEVVAAGKAEDNHDLEAKDPQEETAAVGTSGMAAAAARMDQDQILDGEAEEDTV